MGTDIIPYDPYHPHLGYTLAITCLAWLSVTLYSQWRLSQRPKQRIFLYGLAIGLPVYAEGVSYLIDQVRPAPNTPVGYMLSHFHAYVLQSLPLDTFLEPLTEDIALTLLILIGLSSLLRFGYGTIQLNRMLAQAYPLDEVGHQALIERLTTVAAQQRRPLPPILVIDVPAPLAFTTGILHPRICVSDTLLDTLALDELMAVLCHEWAHILRRDNLWNWSVRLLRDLLFFLPANHILWRSMIASQDEACDALAVKLTREPLALARALVKVAAAWGSHKRPIKLMVASPFALAQASPRLRVEQMIRISDASLAGADRSVGAYVLAGVLLLLSVLPALLGS